jgi:predicted transcriptional regulator of viral defense system
MKKETKLKIKQIFMDNKGYARSKDITSAGIHRKYLSDLMDDRIIIKLKKGLYKWNENEYSAINELVDVSKIVSEGIICLISALSYYELTTYNPLKYQVAIPNSKKIAIPDYPPIKLYYFSEKYYEAGIDEIEIENHYIKIYDIEKTISDCFRYSYEIPKDILLESLKEYISRPDKNINKLMKYAQNTSADKKISNYLEVLL